MEQTGSQVGLDTPPLVAVAPSTTSCTESRTANLIGRGQEGSCADIAAARQAEEMQSLALGGHVSVSNLLYERDCLAAALAAEKRRSGEFEQLWRHSEQQLCDLRSSEREEHDACLAAALAAEKRRSGEFEQLWRHTEKKLYEFCSSETSLFTERLSTAGFQCNGLPLQATASSTAEPQAHEGTESAACVSQGYSPAVLPRGTGSACTKAEEPMPCGGPDGRPLHVPELPTLLGGCRGNLGFSGSGTQASSVVEPSPVPSQTIEPAPEADPEPQPVLTWLKEPVSSQRRVHVEDSEATAAPHGRQSAYETRRSADSAQALLMDQWEEYGGGACPPAFLIEADVKMQEQRGSRTTCAAAAQPASTASTLSRDGNGIVNSSAVCLENLREQFRLEVRDMIKAGTAGPPFLGPGICDKVQQHCTMVVPNQRGTSGKVGQDDHGLANELPRLVPAM